ncbi:MAG: hypothetical protein NC312_12345 [Bacteroides fragilis]|nr:hypothetical protein [Bacteroides fragilis]
MAALKLRLHLPAWIYKAGIFWHGKGGISAIFSVCIVKFYKIPIPKLVKMPKLKKCSKKG